MGILVSMASGQALAIARGEAGASGPAGEVAGSAIPAIEVDESSGTARLSIPIELPPGPNGLRPSLALRYSSETANGMIGVGWQLGLSRIQCARRLGVPIEGPCEAFDLDAMPLLGPDAAGRYHLLEESFDRILRLGSADGADQWSVTSTEGLTMTFGESAESRVEGLSGTAEWHLSSVVDVFGNSIDYHYASVLATGDEGVRYPERILYADGTREVRFVLEGRPDPSVSYAGGVRRVLSRRIREIRVFVNDRVHHRLVLRYAPAASTTQSRLVSVQRFGADCDPIRHPDPADSAECSAMPPFEFDYTDAGVVPGPPHWVPQGAWDDPSRAWFAPFAANFGGYGGNIFGRGHVTQIGDIDGDGLPDVVTDTPEGHATVPMQTQTWAAEFQGMGSGADPRVNLNNGRDGWEEPDWDGQGAPLNESAVWTDRLRALRFDLPVMEVDQVVAGWLDSVGSSASVPTPLMGTCVDGTSLPAVAIETDAGSVQLAGQDRYTAPPFFDSSEGRARTDLANLDQPKKGRVRPWPHFQVVDLDADGLSELVMSIRLSGFHVSLADCDAGGPLADGQEVWVEGAITRVVFRNTGSGWVRDDGADPGDGNWADSLPAFGGVAFESAELVYRKHGASDPLWLSPCDDLGLGGIRNTDQGNGFSPTVNYDFCVTAFDNAPVFHDLNGDGYPDLIVTAPEDPDALLFNEVTLVTAGVLDPGFRKTRVESQAWLQDPTAVGEDPRWIRAPAFDPPFAHSGFMQLPDEQPWGNGVPVNSYQLGHPNVFHMDTGVRFADFNRDGLVDMLASSPFPAGWMETTWTPSGFDGVLLNRGARLHDARHSAWCSSVPLPGIDSCVEDAGRYTSPYSFTEFTGVLETLGSMPVMLSKGFDLVDLNGDGWVDVLRGGFSDELPRAFIHHPGRAGSVWVEDPRFALPVYGLFMSQVESGQGEGPSVPFVSSGYGIMDVNGDGVTDFVASAGGSLPQNESWLSQPGVSHGDLLRSFRNGRGGFVELSYASPLSQRDPEREIVASEHAHGPLFDSDPDNDAQAEPPGRDPFAQLDADPVRWSTLPVLTAMRVRSANRVESETRYRYAHPRRCLEHGLSLGFRLVERIGGDGSVTQSFYWQNHGRTGRLAQRTLFDGSGVPLEFVSAVWESPPPSTVTGGFADPEAGVQAYIGRIRSTLRRKEYGSQVLEDAGPESRTAWTYDDTHGYGFVSEVRREGPGWALRKVSSPAVKDATRHLMRRVRERRLYADGVGDTRLLSRSQIAFADPEGRATHVYPGRVWNWVAARDEPQSGRWLRTDYGYSAEGNLVLESTPGPTEDAPRRLTIHCYDGESGCPPGQGSRSIRSGSRDALGRWTRSTPHAVFAVFERIESDYSNVPTRTQHFDAFGRLEERWLEPTNGSPAHRVLRRIHHDFGVPGAGLGLPTGSGVQQPFRVERRFADDDPESGSTRILVEDGLGGIRLSIELIDPYSALASGGLRARARGVSIDPNSRLETMTQWYGCGSVTGAGSDLYSAIVSSCAGIDPSGLTATRQTRDALGRPVRIEQPAGVQLSRYGSTSWAGWPRDTLLRKDFNGGLTEILYTEGRAVVVRECGQAPDPDLEDLSQADCASPDESRLVYEPDGLLRIRYDPAAFAGGAVGVLDSQRLEYRYDTLGRVVEVHDPDAGRSQHVYDDAGNPSRRLDARGVEVARSYDALGRPTRIEVMGETPTRIFYDGASRYRTRVLDGDIEKHVGYDALGRPWRTRWVVGRETMIIDRHRDLLGRAETIRYPTVLNGVVDQLRYEYDGPVLRRVCEVGSDFGDCSAATATRLVDDVHFDEIGRVRRMGLPGGVRHFEYDGQSLRRARDFFDSDRAGEDVEFSYPAYDALGNVLRFHAEIGPVSDATMEYAFDARNRIEQWSWNGSPKAFRYDVRGNMILHADAAQSFDSIETAHAIRSRTEAGVTYTYDYDAGGNLASIVDSAGGPPRHFSFDGRGRLVCVGADVGGCDELAVAYNGEDDRVREIGSDEFLYAASDFRLRRSGGGMTEYWIEIEALGQRIAYKHGIGGALRRLAETSPVSSSGGARSVGLAPLSLLLLSVLTVTALLASRVPSKRRACTALAVTLSIAVAPSAPRAMGRYGPYSPDGPGLAEFRWVLSDANGSSLVEIDSSGAVTRYAAHAPFGRILESADLGGGAGRRFFAGHDRQEDTGLVYMKARWMNPGSGSFISVDPIVADPRDPQTYNGYSYALNNPIGRIDRDGEAAILLVAAVIAVTWVGIPLGAAYVFGGGADGARSAATGVSIGAAIPAGLVALTAAVAPGVVTEAAVAAGLPARALEAVPAAIGAGIKVAETLSSGGPGTELGRLGRGLDGMLQVLDVMAKAKEAAQQLGGARIGDPSPASGGEEANGWPAPSSGDRAPEQSPSDAGRGQSEAQPRSAFHRVGRLDGPDPGRPRSGGEDPSSVGRKALSGEAFEIIRGKDRGGEDPCRFGC